MQTQLTCAACGAKYWPNQQWIHDKCEDVASNHIVTTQTVTCNQCAEKDAEIERLRNQLEKRKPKRDRAAYMREYRKA